MKQRTGVPWEEIRSELLQDPEIAQAVLQLKPEYEAVRKEIEKKIESEKIHRYDND